jgi:hypothetical protein
MSRCKNKFFHNWQYFKRIHYKYRGPIREYVKVCFDCDTVVMLDSGRHYNPRLERYCKETPDKSSC